MKINFTVIVHFYKMLHSVHPSNIHSQILSHDHCRRKFSNLASKSASASLGGPPPPAAAACGALALLVTPNDCPVDGKPMDRKENVFMLVI